MHILLKNILKEVEDKSLLQIKFYCDMDGVLADMEGGFMKISGGLTPKEYDAKNGKNAFWKFISQIDPVTKKKKYPKFWENLDPMPDAQTLWDYIQDTFKSPPPIILSAGQGQDIEAQKKAWIKKHISATVDVKIAPAGDEKANSAPNEENVVHILLDDTGPGDVDPEAMKKNGTKKLDNITAWENVPQHFGVHHTDAASSIRQIEELLKKLKS
jgi:hypothetical protein